MKKKQRDQERILEESAKASPRPNWTELDGDAGIKLIFHPKVVTILHGKDSTAINRKARKLVGGKAQPKGGQDS